MQITVSSGEVIVAEAFASSGTFLLTESSALAVLTVDQARYCNRSEGCQIRQVDRGHG